MSLVGAVFLVVGFVALARVCALVERSKRVVVLAKQSLQSISNPDLDDDAREKALQRYAKELFFLFFAISLGSLTALGLPAGVVWLLDRAGLMSFESVVTVALSWRFLLSTTLIFTIFLAVYRKR
jgi:hypothetical protein